MTLNANAMSTSGGNQPVATMPPYLVVNYIIAAAELAQPCATPSYSSAKPER